MSNKRDIVRVVTAVLGALKLFLGAFGIDIPQDILDTAANVAAGLVVLYGFIKHNFLGQKGKDQKEQLQKAGLHD